MYNSQRDPDGRDVAELEELEQMNKLVPYDVRYQIEQYKDLVEKSVDAIKSLPIQGREDAEKALDLACDAINLKERIEDKVDEIIGPAKQFQAEVKAIARDFVNNLDEVKGAVVGKIEDWKLGSCYVGKLGTSKISANESTTYEFHVTNLDKVPREYLTIDEDRIKLDVKAGKRKIQGLEIVEKKKTILRRSA